MDTEYAEWASTLDGVEHDDVPELHVRRLEPVPLWHGTLRLAPEQQAAVQLKRGIRESIKRFQREPRPEYTWPEGGPMTSTEDFTPVAL